MYTSGTSFTIFGEAKFSMKQSKVSQAFIYTLPDERIAQEPPVVRGASRLMVVDRQAGTIHDDLYKHLSEYVRPGDVIIINETRVIPARLLATTASGGTRELFLTERHRGPLLATNGRVMYRGKLRAGDILRVNNDTIEVLAILGDGEAQVRATVPLVVLAERAGKTPLPPYIKRDARTDDKDRYQTVFARHDGSVAAPTASLNLTEDILRSLVMRGAIIAKLTLHVGRGTFLPIRSASIDQHVMHKEYYSIPKKTIVAIRAAKQGGSRVIAIGTTVTRALEHAAHYVLDDNEASIRDEADLFIYPGYDFRIVDVLLTNFHAPDSTVLQLAAAFAGTDLLKRGYDHALAGDYRFLSYGDSMLIA